MFEYLKSCNIFKPGPKVKKMAEDCGHGSDRVDFAVVCICHVQVREEMVLISEQDNNVLSNLIS